MREGRVECADLGSPQPRHGGLAVHGRSAFAQMEGVIPGHGNGHKPGRHISNAQQSGIEGRRTEPTPFSAFQRFLDFLWVLGIGYEQDEVRIQPSRCLSAEYNEGLPF
ncbi:hypothetical protein GCM10007881_26930 [Mesorhizobium huakuii]|nr:hypothetical protein GCM10007881_26930 [Mesorhizobium huakuii]